MARRASHGVKKNGRGKGGIEGECPRPLTESRAVRSSFSRSVPIFVIGENHLALANEADEGCLRALDRLMIAAREGSDVVHHYAWNRFPEAFERLSYLMPFRIARLSDGGSKQ